MEVLEAHKTTWWLIPVSKWIITPVISQLTLLSSVITRGTTYLLSGENHQVELVSAALLQFYKLQAKTLQLWSPSAAWARGPPSAALNQTAAKFDARPGDQP